MLTSPVLMRTLLFLGILVSFAKGAVTKISHWELATAPRADSVRELQRAFGKPGDYRSLQKIPETWPDADRRVFTYRAVIPDTFPAGNIHLGLGLSSQPILLVWNGIPVHRWGESDNHFNGTRYQGETVILPASLRRATGNVLVVQMYPRGVTISLPEIVLGAYGEIGEFAHMRSLLNLVLPGAATLASLLMMVMVLALWAALGKTREDWLWFSLASSGITMSFTATVFSSPLGPEVLTNAISRVGLLLTNVGVQMCLLHHAGAQRVLRIWRWPGLALALAFGGYICLGNDRIDVNGRFSTALIFLIYPTLVFGSLSIGWLCLRRREVRDLIMGVGFVALFCTSFHDTWYFQTGKVPIAWLFPLGFVALELAMLAVINLELLKLWRQNQQRALDLDKTSLTLAEERMRTEQALRTRALFLERMAHEFRTPLQGLLGMVDLLKGAHSAVDPQILKGTERQLRGHMARINNTIDLDDLRQGTLRLRQVKFDPLFLEDGWRQEFSMDDDPPTSRIPTESGMAIGDPERIDRVVSNFGRILSAGGEWPLQVDMQFFDGKMVVRLTRQELVLEQLQAMVQNRIEDPNDEAIQVLLQAMGVQVQLFSEYGRTGIALEIPVQAVHRHPGGETEVPIANVPGSQNRSCVLLAEDERVNARLLTSLLERNGCRVVWAKNGEEAVAMVEKEKPDLILMDVNMPVMDGLQATRILRMRESTRHLVIVGVTAHAQQEDVINAGMDGYLAKPVRASQLRELVERHCRTRGV